MRRVRQLLAGLGIAASAIGLLIDLRLVLPSRAAETGYGEALVYFWSYFTHLTNLWLVLVWLGALTAMPGLRWLARPAPRTSAATFITLVMGFYHFLLAPYLEMDGALQVATILLHYVAPVLFLVWWIALPDHGSLRWAQIPAMLLPGVAYVGWVLLRGAVTGDYPYAILDAGAAGYPAVGIGVAVLLVAVTAFAGLLVALDHLLGRDRSMR